MFFLIIVIAILVVGCLNFGGQAAATYNHKQENKASMDRAVRNGDEWTRRTARENDYYYDPVCKSFDPSFYSDGSIRVDHHTKKTYAKGEYMCDSQGNNCQWKKAGPEVKRPPSK